MEPLLTGNIAIPVVEQVKQCRQVFKHIVIRLNCFVDREVMVLDSFAPTDLLESIGKVGSAEIDDDIYASLFYLFQTPSVSRHHLFLDAHKVSPLTMLRLTLAIFATGSSRMESAIEDARPSHNPLSHAPLPPAI